MRFMVKSGQWPENGLPVLICQPLLRPLLEYRLNPAVEERKFWLFTDLMCNSANND